LDLLLIDSCVRLLQHLGPEGNTDSRSMVL
jgi:hypothetical protein